MALNILDVCLEPQPKSYEIDITLETQGRKRLYHLEWMRELQFQFLLEGIAQVGA